MLGTYVFTVSICFCFLQMYILFFYCITFVVVFLQRNQFKWYIAFILIIEDKQTCSARLFLKTYFIEIRRFCSFKRGLH